MTAALNKESKPRIKVEKQANGRVTVHIEDLQIDGNMMDVEEGVLAYLNQAGTAIMKEALEQNDVEGDPLFCLQKSGRARGDTPKHTRPHLEKQK
jgi:hypothetical protein